MVTQRFDGYYLGNFYCKGNNNIPYKVHIGRNISRYELHNARLVNVEFDIVATVTKIISFSTEYLAKEILYDLFEEDIKEKKYKQMKFELGGCYREKTKAKNYCKQIS